MANLTKENISVTPGNFELSGGVITAISGYPVGGTGSIIESPYHGDTETINVDQNTKIISISNKYKSKIDNIPTKVTDLTDSASYPKKTYVDETFQTKDDMSAYATKDYIEEVSGELDAAFKEEVSGIEGDIKSKQTKLTYRYTENGEISAFGTGSQLSAIYTGEDLYDVGTDLKLDENNVISVDTNGNPHNDTNTRNFVEGSWTEASGYNSHAEGMATTAYGYAVHAQGMWTKFSSCKWHDTTHPNDIDIYWAPGAGATVEGYCNATTSCPMSGEGNTYGPIHGGVLKVIGNGNVVHDLEPDPDAHVHTLNPSDALIIFKDGTISAFGDIYKNGKKYITEGNFAQGNAYAMTTTGWEAIQAGGQGIQQVLHDDTLDGNGNANSSLLRVDTTKIQPVSGMTAYATTALLDSISSKIELDIPSIAGLATEIDLQKVSAGVDYVSGALTGYYTKDETSGATELSTEFAKYQPTGYYATSAGLTAGKQYAMTTTGWEVVQAGTSFTGVTTTGSISGGGVNNDTIGLLTSAENALTSVANKVDKPSSLIDKYLVLRTDNAGNVSGWCDFQDQSYSKTEALGTFVATANIDSTTLSGDGKSVNTKLGVKTDVIATRDYVNSSFLPTSGGTVSGQLVVSGDGNFDQENLKFIRSGLNGYGRIGLASNGALAVKVDDSNSNTTQINVAANASYNELIQVQHGGTTAYLIPAVTANTTAGLTNDGILHIIVES